MKLLVAIVMLFFVATAFAEHPSAAEDPTGPMRVGLTPAFLHDQHDLLDEWRRYMERKLDRRVEFVLRDNYRETIDMLRLGRLDFAWISDYPYVYLKSHVRLVAVPLFRGRPYYRSYLIVPSTELEVASILDLRGTVFAYADPYSNSGYLYPRYELHRQGEDPARFFRKTFFGWSHRHVVEAVAWGVAQGGAVDSLVWESLAVVAPELTSATRIVSQSPEYGSPPFVAKRLVSEEDFRVMQQLLLDMSGDAQGADLLRRLNIDGFTHGDPHSYEGIALMMRAFGEE